MITEQDLREAIAECEGQRHPTASTCMKLAAFYAIQDKMYPDTDREPIQEQEEMQVHPSYAHSYSHSSMPDDEGSRTEFRQAIVGMDAEEFLSVMDELMSTIKVMVPRLYEGVMRKLT